jgi:hypothetical protein
LPPHVSKKNFEGLVNVNNLPKVSIFATSSSHGRSMRIIAHKLSKSWSHETLDKIFGYPDQYITDPLCATRFLLSF